MTAADGQAAVGSSGLPGLLEAFVGKLAQQLAPATALLRGGQVGNGASSALPQQCCQVCLCSHTCSTAVPQQLRMPASLQASVPSLAALFAKAGSAAVTLAMVAQVRQLM